MSKPVRSTKRLYEFLSLMLLSLLLCGSALSEEVQFNDKLFLEYYNQSERMINTKDDRPLFAIKERSDGVYVVSEAALLDNNGNMLWRTKLPNELIANMTFSFTETDDGFFAFVGNRLEDKTPSLTVLDKDGRLTSKSLIIQDDMQNPIVVSDGVVFMRVDEETDVRTLCKVSWDGNTTESVLEGIQRFAAYVAQTQKNNTYVYGFASAAKTNVSDALFVLDQNGNLAWKYAKESETVIPVWYELDNSDTIICTSSVNLNKSSIRRVSSKGDVVWSREIVGTGSNFTPKQMYENPDGSLSVAGYAKMTTPVADRMMFIITFTAEGIEKRVELIKDHLLLPTTHNVHKMILLDVKEDNNQNELVPLLLVTRESEGYIGLK